MLCSLGKLAEREEFKKIAEEWLDQLSDCWYNYKQKQRTDVHSLALLIIQAYFFSPQKATGLLLKLSLYEDFAETIKPKVLAELYSRLCSLKNKRILCFFGNKVAQKCREVLLKNKVEVSRELWDMDQKCFEGTPPLQLAASEEKLVPGILEYRRYCKLYSLKKKLRIFFLKKIYRFWNKVSLTKPLACGRK